DPPALRGDAGPRTGGRQMAAPRSSRLAKTADGTPKVETKPTAGGLEQVVSPALPPIAPAPAGIDRAAPHFGHRMLQAPAAPSDRAVFDWRQAQIRQVNGEWCLQAGSMTLARFGTNFRDAQMAHAALRHYRFSAQRRVGEPAVALYTATAQSPRGVLLGLPAENFQLDQLAVQQVGKNYALMQGQRVVLSIGPRKDDASKMLEVVK